MGESVLDYRFFLQDPTAVDTSYLYEEIVAQLDLPLTIEFMGIFAFVSEKGISALLEDPALKDFLKRGGACTLLAGLDAITNPAALDRMADLAAKHELVQARVFHNPSKGLFHPKLALFKRENGDQVMIVGSGNLTPGGLRGNIEAFSALTFTDDDDVDLGMLDSFLTRHSASIRPIDNDAIERAKENSWKAPATPKIGGEAEPDAEQDEEALGVDILEDSEEEETRNDRVMVAEVPRAGNRWGQLHLNKDVVKQFFRVESDSHQRVFLREVVAPGRLGDVEARPCVYSETNKNHKIEFAARKGEPYPDEGRPVLVIRETGTRSFQYLILMPGEPGYAEMEEFLTARPSVGKGLRRVISTRRDLTATWADCPL